MKITSVLLFLVVAVGHSVAQTFIDPATTAGIAPANTNIGTGWELNFSDEYLWLSDCASFGFPDGDYDTVGRKVNSHFPETSFATIEINTSGVFIVKAKLENGEFIRRKILIQ